MTTTPEMVEKARAHYRDNLPVAVAVSKPDKWLEFIPEWPSRGDIIEFAADFAQSAVRDAVREPMELISEMIEHLQDWHPEHCKVEDGIGGCAEDWLKRAAALRQKFGVGE